MNNKEKYASCVQTKLCSRPFAYRLCRLDYADFKSGLRNPLRGGQRWPQAGIRDAVMPRLCANVKKEMAYRFVPNGFFLDASSHLYKRVCPSVPRSVGHAFSINVKNQLSISRESSLKIPPPPPLPLTPPPPPPPLLLLLSSGHIASNEVRF